MDEYIFPKRFKRLIFEGELSQQELADRLGVTKQAVSGWANGRRFPKTDMVKRIADIYGVSVDYFFDKQEQNVSSIMDTQGNTIDSALDVAKRFSKLTEEQQKLVIALFNQLGV